jgi:endonuclease-3
MADAGPSHNHHPYWQSRSPFPGDADEEMAMQWLVTLPGVGPKIAAAVLNFSTLRKRQLVVDTHLLRVGRRLGVLSAASDYQTGHDDFMRLIPTFWDGDDLSQFHRLMNSLGQGICMAIAPACGRCPLQDLCPRCGC